MRGMTWTTKSGRVDVASGSIRWLTLTEESSGPSGLEASPDFLHPEEIAHRDTLKVDKRRRDWTLGRRAAKELLAELIREKTGFQIALSAIVVIPHPDGWPVVTLPENAGVGEITLSISHTRDVAFCAATEGANRLLGADIEFVETRAAAFAEAYYTDLERRFLAAAAADQQTILLNAIWSGKEAGLKAIRRGLAEDTRIVACLPHPIMNNEAEWLPMRIEWTDERAAQSMPPLRGYWRHEGDFVLTLAFAATAVT